MHIKRLLRAASCAAVAVILLFGLSTAGVVAQSTRYVYADAGGTNDGTSWTDAFNSLQDVLAASSSGDQIWVAEGTLSIRSTEQLQPPDQQQQS